MAQYSCNTRSDGLGLNATTTTDASPPRGRLTKRLRPIKFFLSLTATCLIATAVHAVPLSVGTTGSPLVMDAGTTAGTITVNVVNASTPDAAVDFLVGWQLGLFIEPDAGSTGAVGFTSASLPGPGENYLLESVSTFSDTIGFNPIISQIITPNGSTAPQNALSAFDGEFSALPAGVEVPQDPGANLLNLSFFASNNAGGTFGLFLAGPFPDSAWTDAGTLNDQDFANFQVTSEPVRIGDIQVNAVVVEPGVVPEPGTAGLGLLSIAALGAALKRRWRTGGDQ